MMSMSPLDFARLMASRLCHDLISPLSAVSNGLEIFAEEQDPVMKERALNLAQDSLKALEDRLCCFRMAWGMATSMPSYFQPFEISDLLASVLKNHKTELVLELDAPLEKQQGQILLCMALSSSEMLHRGGEMILSSSESGLTVKATGKRVRFSEDQKDLLTNPEAFPKEARHLTPVFLRLLVGTSDGKLSFNYEEDILFEMDYRLGK